MRVLRHRLTLALVLLGVAATFVLPMVTVSERATTIDVMGVQFGLDPEERDEVKTTGLQLAAHRVPGAECNRTEFGCTDPNMAWAVEQGGDVPAAVAFGAAILALALVLVRPRWRRATLALVLLGTAAIAVLPFAVRMLPRGYYVDPPHVEPGAGWLVGLALFVVAFGLQLARLEPSATTRHKALFG